MLPYTLHQTQRAHLLQKSTQRMSNLRKVLDKTPIETCMAKKRTNLPHTCGVSCSVCLKDNLMGPRWKGKGSEAKALVDPMSKIVSQLRSSLIEIAADGLLSGCSVLLAVEAEQTELLTRACFGRPIIAAEKDKQLFQLGLEEAFYFCHYLKCLKLVGKDNREENVDQLWQYMKSKNGSFPESYKAYSHLRKKNWVVRPGSQYGVDFVAYRHHPSLVHSEYAVLVLSAEGGDANGRLRVLSDFHCTIRLCGSVVKTLLVLWVNKNGYGTDSPSCLEDYSIEEMTVTRWSPEQSRESQTATKNGAKIVETKQVQ